MPMAAAAQLFDETLRIGAGCVPAPGLFRVQIVSGHAKPVIGDVEHQIATHDPQSYETDVASFLSHCVIPSVFFQDKSIGLKGNPGLCVSAMVDTTDAQSTGDLNEQASVVNVEHLIGGHLGTVQRQTVNVGIRLAQSYKAGGNEKIDDRSQIEGPDAVYGQLAAFIAYGNHFQAVSCFQASDQIQHFRHGFGWAHIKAWKSCGVKGRSV
jgi:hypothetical protein